MKCVYIVLIMILISVAGFVADGRCAGEDGSASAAVVAGHASGEATGPVETASGTLAAREATVVMVKDSAVMLDKGIADGLSEGMVVPLYYAVGAGAAGSVGTDSIKVADVSIVQAEEHICLGVLVDAQGPAARGMKVRYGVHEVQAGAGAEAAKDGAAEVSTGTKSCPGGMQFVSGGEFVWKAGSRDSDEKIESTEAVENTGDFCVDIEAEKERVKWSEAVASCAARGLGLCTMQEQHKMCLKHGKKPRCAKSSPDQVCPRGDALEDFGPQLEWSAAWMEPSREDESVYIKRMGSCSCNSGTGGCSVCYYPECGSAVKKYRCCMELK